MTPIRRGRTMQVGEVSFYCGEAGGIHVTDEHDVFADEYAWKMRVAHHEAQGEWPSVDQIIEWTIRARNASIRSMTVEESDALDAARELLEKRGYVVTDSLAGASVLALDPSRSTPEPSTSTSSPIGAPEHG